MTTKICILCEKEKEISDFYKHPKMPFGVDSKCKECVKERAKIREEKLRKDINWVEKERDRGREKHHRLYSNIQDKKLDSQNRRIWMTEEERKYSEKENKNRYLKKYPNAKKESVTRYKIKYPEKVKAKNASSHLKSIIKGNHLHHWNYNIEFAKDVIELNAKDHAKIHRFISYDKETFMYKTLDGVLLDTKEKHLNAINTIINQI